MRALPRLCLWPDARREFVLAASAICDAPTISAFLNLSEMLRQTHRSEGFRLSMYQANGAVCNYDASINSPSAFPNRGLFHCWGQSSNAFVRRSYKKVSIGQRFFGEQILSPFEECAFHYAVSNSSPTHIKCIWWRHHSLWLTSFRTRLQSLYRCQKMTVVWIKLLNRRLQKKRVNSAQLAARCPRS